MPPKIKKVEPGRLPARYELSLGNKSTKYNELTWAAAACGVAAKSSSNPLRMTAKLYHVNVPPGSSGSGVYGTYEEIARPCEPRVLRQALERGKKMIERGEATRVEVTSQAEYVHGYSQRGHHAMWNHGGYELDHAGLGRSQRSPRKRRR